MQILQKDILPLKLGNGYAGILNALDLDPNQYSTNSMKVTKPNIAPLIILTRMDVMQKSRFFIFKSLCFLAKV